MKILSVLSLISSIIFGFECVAYSQSQEFWTYGVIVKHRYIQSLKQKVIAAAKKKSGKKRLKSKDIQRLAAENLRKEFLKNGLEIIYKVDGDTYRLKSLKAASKPKFAEDLVPLSHSAYFLDEFNTEKNPVTGAVSGRSVTACPSVPDATKCNGFTNDPIGSWALNPLTGMAVNEAWKKSKGDNVVVAILSTGAKLDHPDLVSNLWTDTAVNFAAGESSHGFNAYSNAVPDDIASGTGTALAGIIAAKANNSIGLPGISFNSKLMIVKALDEQQLSKDKVLAGLNYVLKKKREGHNIRVILAPNFYFGTQGFDAQFLSVSQSLNSEGVLIVGNVSRFNSDPNLNIDGSFNNLKYFPLHYTTGNILISSTYKHGDFTTTLPVPLYSSTQNIGPNTVHLSAPGEYIYTTYNNGSYIYFSGGSIGAANAAGAAALLFSRVASLNPSQIINALKDNTRLYPGSFAGKTISQGALDVGKAMNAVFPQPIITGDFDGDGCVSGNDYLIFQRTFGNIVTPGTSADANGNGVVDSADYVLWRDSYGLGC